MQVRKTAFEDLKRIEEIYENARVFMAKNDNPHQWYNSYPETSVLIKDISQGNSYVIEENSRIIGVFSMFFEKDPTYSVID